MEGALEDMESMAAVDDRAAVAREAAAASREGVGEEPGAMEG